jgi:hypothetical protein
MDNWLFNAVSANSRVQQPVGGQRLAEITAAKAGRRLEKVLAFTNQSGTRYYQINDAGPDNVTIGADITHLFNKRFWK